LEGAGSGVAAVTALAAKVTVATALPQTTCGVGATVTGLLRPGLGLHGQDVQGVSATDAACAGNAFCNVASTMAHAAKAQR
jgi:hypothetical protein